MNNLSFKPSTPSLASVAPLSVLVVTYNSARVLPGLLDSLPEGLDGVREYEVVIVDNQSRDGSIDIARSHSVRPRTIRMGRNVGYAAAINAAAATVAKGANLLILNPDVRLQPGAARALVERLADPSIGVAVPKIWTEDGQLAWSLRREPSLVTAWTDAILGGNLAARIGVGERVGNNARYAREGLIDWAEGSILAVAARTREVVGGWDESFFLYSEETEYMRRVREQGLGVVYVPDAEAVHLGGDVENPALSALLALNRIRYYRKHHGAVSTSVFRLSVIVGEGMRAPRGGAHRAAFRAALMCRASAVSGAAGTSI